MYTPVRTPLRCPKGGSRRWNTATGSADVRRVKEVPKERAAAPRVNDPGPTASNEAAEMCGYVEYDSDLGKWFECGLRVHGPKVKHARGKKR
jgi:hypothetical protein